MWLSGWLSNAKKPQISPELPQFELRWRRRADRLGHATPAFTLTVYRHAIPGAQEAAAERLAAMLDPSYSDQGQALDKGLTIVPLAPIMA